MWNKSNKPVKHCSTDDSSWLHLFFKRLGKETAVGFCWLLCSRSTVETHLFSEGCFPKCFHSNTPSNSPNIVAECHCSSQTGSGEPEWTDSWQTWGFSSASALALAVSRTKWKGDLDKILHRLLGQRALLTSFQSFAHKSIMSKLTGIIMWKITATHWEIWPPFKGGKDSHYNGEYCKHRAFRGPLLCLQNQVTSV